MKTLEVSMTIIKRGDTFVLQRRPVDPNIGASGLIGCFGGKREQGETAEDAAYRELFEELDIQTDHDSIDLKHIDDITVESDYQMSSITANVAVFYLEVANDVVLQAKEGDIEELTLEEVKRDVYLFSPATGEAFKNLIRSM